MSPRQLCAWREHGEAIDRMQDARDLFVGMLAGSGNENEIGKHFEAWSKGETPAAAKQKKELTEEDKAKLLAMRTAWDIERAARKQKPANGG